MKHVMHRGAFAKARDFWMVYCPTGHTPSRVEHATIDIAKKEAIRLAALNPGSDFYVMEGMAMFTVENDPTLHEHDLSVPF